MSKVPIGLVVTCLTLVMVVGAVDQTLLAPALPMIASDLGGLEIMPFVVTAYLLAATMSMPVHGRLGDRFGRRPVLLAALALFLVGACASAASPTAAWLIIARFVQGAGGGGLVLGAQAILGDVVSPRDRGRYLGIIGSGYIIAAVGGPPVGAVIAGTIGWRWIFVSYVPLGLAALAGVAVFVRPARHRLTTRADVAGSAAVVAFIGAVVLLASAPSLSLSAWVVSALVVAAAGAFAVWLWSARRAEAPVIPLRLFRDPAIGLPIAIGFLLGAALFGTVSFLPALLQLGLGTPATAAGFALTVVMLGVVASMSLSGWLISRTGHYRPYPIAGTALATAGLGAVGFFRPGVAPAFVLIALAALGLGVGMVMQVIVLVAQNAADAVDLGVATSTVVLARQLGATVGAAAVGAAIHVRLQGAPQPDAPDFPSAYAEAVAPVLGCGGAVLVIAFVLALLLPARTLRRTTHDESEGAEEPVAERRRT